MRLDRLLFNASLRPVPGIKKQPTHHDDGLLLQCAQVVWYAESLTINSLANGLCAHYRNIIVGQTVSRNAFAIKQWSRTRARATNGLISTARVSPATPRPRGSERLLLL